MRNSNVRVISLDRRRSGIVDRSDPMHSEWRIFFRLTPRPIRLWDRHFERLVLTLRQQNELTYSYRLVREARSYSTYYGSRRARLLSSIWSVVTRRGMFGVEVICPSRAEDLQNATRELARIVARTNLSYVGSAESNRASELAARVATNRLVTALDSVDKQLKKKTIQLEAAKVVIAGENVLVGAD